MAIDCTVGAGDKSPAEVGGTDGATGSLQVEGRATGREAATGVAAGRSFALAAPFVARKGTAAAAKNIES